LTTGVAYFGEPSLPYHVRRATWFCGRHPRQNRLLSRTSSRGRPTLDAKLFTVPIG